MDWFRESIDSHHIVTTNHDSKKILFVPYNTNPANPGFISFRESRILTLEDSLWIFSHKSSQFSKIRLFLRIQRILSTIAQNESLKIEIREYESWSFGFANPNLKDLYHGFDS